MLVLSQSKKVFIIKLDYCKLRNISDQVDSPNTLTKGVRQTAKLHFRKEDFIKSRKKRTIKDATPTLGGPEDRYVEGKDDKDTNHLATPTNDGKVNMN